MKDPFDTATEDFISRPVKRALLEKDIQKACVDWARDNGWWARKFSSPANRSVPDYLFARLSFTGLTQKKIAVEFKAPGKDSTKAQIEEQAAMRAAGWDVIQVDNVEYFKTVFLQGYP